MRRFKVIIENCPAGYVAYPLGLRGVVVGQGNTCEEALADVKSAIKSYLETSVTRRLKPIRLYLRCS